MARSRDRIIALVMAVLFFATSVGVSVLIVWEAFAGNKEAKTVNQDKLLLQGTKLADFTPVSKVETLQKIDVEPGTGKEVKAGDTVTVDYTGAEAATGVIFESSLDKGETFTTPLGDVIKGWQEGVPGMKEGGKRRILIPAAMAYGDADLVFDITLHKVEE